MSDQMTITPSTKISALLDHYPELEEALIAMAPPFKKLKNPLLRRGVARVASIRQAAAVARIPVEEMVNRLRLAVGQGSLDSTTVDLAADYLSRQPDWFDPDRVVASVDERKVDANVMPINPLIRRATRLRKGEIIELLTNYIPAPGIDIMKGKGFQAWCTEEVGSGVFRTFFSKAG